VKKYEQASLGIILQIILNNFFIGVFSFNELKRQINRLKNEGLRINFISLYWFLFGTMRGLKNFLFR
jgi:hypothetical protein